MASWLRVWNNIGTGTRLLLLVKAETVKKRRRRVGERRMKSKYDPVFGGVLAAADLCNSILASDKRRETCWPAAATAETGREKNKRRAGHLTGQSFITLRWIFMEAFRSSHNGPVDQDIGSLVDRLGHNKATRYRIIRSKPSVKLLRCIYVFAAAVRMLIGWSASQTMDQQVTNPKTARSIPSPMGSGRASLPSYFKLNWIN